MHGRITEPPGGGSEACCDGSLVVDVFCRCDNHNLCARCLRPLAEWRLDACAYFEPEREVLHIPTFAALSHECAVDVPSLAN